MKGCPGDDEFTVVFAGLKMECAPKLRKSSNSEVRYLRDHHCNIQANGKRHVRCCHLRKGVPGGKKGDQPPLRNH